jgi:multifunctional beta-oxidation protein
MPIDLSVVGKQLPPITHTYSERDVMLYALGVGAGTDDLQFTYERELKVLPTFGVIPAFPAMFSLGPVMQVNPMMILHGEQRIELYAPIPTRGTLTTTPTVRAIYDKTKGALIIVDAETVGPSPAARVASAATAARAARATSRPTAGRTRSSRCSRCRSKP